MAFRKCIVTSRKNRTPRRTSGGEFDVHHSRFEWLSYWRAVASIRHTSSHLPHNSGPFCPLTTTSTTIKIAVNLKKAIVTADRRKVPPSKTAAQQLQRRIAQCAAKNGSSQRRERSARAKLAKSSSTNLLVPKPKGRKTPTPCLSRGRNGTNSFGGGHVPFHHVHGGHSSTQPYAH